jgi:hypothetical protein
MPETEEDSSDELARLRTLSLPGPALAIHPIDGTPFRSETSLLSPLTGSPDSAPGSKDAFLASLSVLAASRAGLAPVPISATFDSATSLSSAAPGPALYSAPAASPALVATPSSPEQLQGLVGSYVLKTRRTASLRGALSETPVTPDARTADLAELRESQRIGSGRCSSEKDRAKASRRKQPAGEGAELDAPGSAYLASLEQRVKAKGRSISLNSRPGEAGGRAGGGGAEREGREGGREEGGGGCVFRDAPLALAPCPPLSLVPHHLLIPRRRCCGPLCPGPPATRLGAVGHARGQGEGHRLPDRPAPHCAEKGLHHAGGWVQA